jgi:hypothetical protein
MQGNTIFLPLFFITNFPLTGVQHRISRTTEYAYVYVSVQLDTCLDNTMATIYLYSWTCSHQVHVVQNSYISAPDMCRVSLMVPECSNNGKGVSFALCDHAQLIDYTHLIFTNVPPLPKFGKHQWAGNCTRGRQRVGIFLVFSSWSSAWLESLELHTCDLKKM